MPSNAATASDRERRTDTIASQIGELLLKGHKMLANPCQACNNILMQDRQGTIMCIACNEERDESGGTISKIQEMQATAAGDKAGVGTVTSLSATEDILLTEIKAATVSLQNIPTGSDLHLKQTYIRHIRDCAETIRALRNITK